jgi:1-deoxy-D-xylulose-5-phosphate synthase
MKILGIPDVFIEHGSVEELQKSIGLDVEGLKKVFNNML